MLAYGPVPLATLCLLTWLATGCRVAPRESTSVLDPVSLRGAPLAAEERSWLLARVQRCLRLGAAFFGEPAADPLFGQPLEIWVVRDPAVWDELRALATGQHLGPAFFLTSPEPEGERLLRVVLGETPSGALPVDPGALAHELGHALLAARRPEPGPAWLEEGFAEWLRVQTEPERGSQLLARAAAEGPWQATALMERPALRADDANAYARAYALFVQLARSCGEHWPRLVLGMQPGSAAEQRAAIEKLGSWPE